MLARRLVFPSTISNTGEASKQALHYTPQVRALLWHRMIFSSRIPIPAGYPHRRCTTDVRTIQRTLGTTGQGARQIESQCSIETWTPCVQVSASPTRNDPTSLYLLMSRFFFFVGRKGTSCTLSHITTTTSTITMRPHRSATN